MDDARIVCEKKSVERNERVTGSKRAEGNEREEVEDGERDSKRRRKDNVSESPSEHLNDQSRPSEESRGESRVQEKSLDCMIEKMLEHTAKYVEEAMRCKAALEKSEMEKDRLNVAHEQLKAKYSECIEENNNRVLQLELEIARLKEEKKKMRADHERALKEYRQKRLNEENEIVMKLFEQRWANGEIPKKLKTVEKRRQMELEREKNAAHLPTLPPLGHGKKTSPRIQKIAAHKTSNRDDVAKDSVENVRGDVIDYSSSVPSPINCALSSIRLPSTPYTRLPQSMVSLPSTLSDIYPDRLTSGISNQSRSTAQPTRCGSPDKVQYHVDAPRRFPVATSPTVNLGAQGVNRMTLMSGGDLPLPPLPTVKIERPEIGESDAPFDYDAIPTVSSNNSNNGNVVRNKVKLADFFKKESPRVKLEPPEVITL